jgi:hypothetical protein
LLNAGSWKRKASLAVKQTFEDYCQQLSGQAAQLAQEAEVRECFEHLSAFNFGRTVQRLEDARQDFWVRVRWLLIGAAVGAAFAAALIQVLGAGG